MTGAEIVAGYEEFRQEMRRLVPGISEHELHETMLQAVERPQYKVVVMGVPETEWYPDVGFGLTRQDWFGVQLVNDRFEITKI